MSRGRAAVPLLLGLAALGSAAARAEEPPPRLELYTMGPGSDVFSQFGHAAVCVFDDRSPEGLCYNYGTTDFSTPLPLTWDVLRGRARFWVSVGSADRMLEHYQRDDRTVYRQILPLAPEAARVAAARFARDARPENRTYVYNHFADNCTTRLRDNLDAVTGGALRAGADAPYAASYRDLLRRGFSTDLLLLTAQELMIGRAVQRRPTLWEAMFLPDVLRAQVAARMGAPAEVVAERRHPIGRHGEAAGIWTLLLGGLGLAALAGTGVASGRRAPRRAALALAGLTLGLLALVIDALALMSQLPEMRRNELLLVLLPTDLGLVFLGGRALRGYLGARLLLLVPVAAAAAVGWLVQPLWAPLALVAAVTGACLAAERRLLASGPGR